MRSWVTRRSRVGEIRQSRASTVKKGEVKPGGHRAATKRVQTVPDGRISARRQRSGDYYAADQPEGQYRAYSAQLPASCVTALLSCGIVSLAPEVPRVAHEVNKEAAQGVDSCGLASGARTKLQPRKSRRATEWLFARAPTRVSRWARFSALCR